MRTVGIFTELYDIKKSGPLLKILEDENMSRGDCLRK